ncbi:hypothetical protein R1A27_17005 [Methylobacterium sp. NMS12]|uniref:hypothetical protein n=1 Tax=Methylobacterium sp. NMS12 TaxID=3079766 RepID=UPI003F882DD3
MVRTDPFTALTEGRRRQLPWYQLVEALRDLENTSLGDPEGRPWVKVAAERSGYTANQLRQMDRTMAGLEVLAKEHAGVSLDAALSRPYNHLEIIVRIAKLAAADAVGLLTGAGNVKSCTYRDLRAHYEKLRAGMTGRASPRSAGQQTSQAFIRAAFAMLSVESNLRTLCGRAFDDGPCALQKWPGGFTYANPDFMITQTIGQRRSLFAVECVSVYGDVNQDASVREVLRCSVEATFFKKYFLVLPRWSPIDLVQVHRHRLALNNVGIAVIGESELIVVTHPDGDPLPDRQRMVLDNVWIADRIRHHGRMPR